jgi:hypothetical protein
VVTAFVRCRCLVVCGVVVVGGLCRLLVAWDLLVVVVVGGVGGQCRGPVVVVACRCFRALVVVGCRCLVVVVVACCRMERTIDDDICRRSSSGCHAAATWHLDFMSLVGKGKRDQYSSNKGDDERRQMLSSFVV